MKAEKKYTISAQRINEALIDAGMKAQDLADKTGIAKASISHYVNGYYCPTSSKAKKMADVLGVSPVWLMGFDVPKYSQKSSVTEDLIKDIAIFLRDGDMPVVIEKNPVREKIDEKLNNYDQDTLERLLNYLSFFETMNGGDKK